MKKKTSTNLGTFGAIIFPPIIGLIYYFYNFGLVDGLVFQVIKMLGLAYTILLAPSFIQNLFSGKISLTFSVLLVFATLCLFGYLANILEIDVSYLVISIGFILLILYLKNFKREYSIIKQVFLCLFFILFAIVVADMFWCRGFHSPHFIFRAALFENHTDIYFHSAISNMIKTYGVPSLGIDGVQYTQYHWGIHVFFAYFSSLMNIETTLAYNLFYPGIFFAFFIQSIFLLIQEIAKKETLEYYTFFAIFFAVFISMTIGFFNSHTIPSRTLLFSESQLISISFAFLFFHFLLSNSIQFSEKKSISFVLLLKIALFVVFLGILKISTLSLSFLILCYLFFRLKMYKHIIGLFQFLVITICCYVTYKLTVPSVYSDGSLNTLTSISDMFQRHKILMISFVTYMFIIITYFVLKKQIGKIIFRIIHTETQTIFETLLLTSLATLFLFFIMDMGNISYFFNIVFWIFLILIMVNIIFISESHKQYLINKAHIIKPIAILVIILYTSNNTHKHWKRMFANNVDMREKIISQDSPQAKSEVFTKKYSELTKKKLNTNIYFKFINNLDSLKHLRKKVKQNTCIYIPKTDSIFWQKRGNREESLFVQTFSEIALLQGYPHNKNYDFYRIQKNSLQHDLQSENLPDSLLIELAKIQHFKTIFIINFKNKDFTIREIKI